MKPFILLIFFLFSFCPMFCFSQIYNVGNGEGFGIYCIDWQPPEILPGAFLKVEACCSGNSISIKWSVVSAFENDVFVVERSSDGFHFESVGEVRVSENKYTLQNFSINDPNPASGKSFYRIHYTKINGNDLYSQIFLCNCRLTDSPAIQIYPNPASSYINVSAKQYINSFVIRNNYGQVVLYKKLNSQTALIAIGHLKPGTYITIIETSAGFFYDKLVIHTN